jgi:hypothetical protein
MSVPGSALGIYSGLNSGTPQGDTSAAINAAKLYGKLANDPSIQQGAGAAGNVLGIYSGLQQGGWGGYGGAAVNSAQLAGNLLNMPGLSSAAGYVAAPLALYNFGKNWQSGATGSDTLNGAEAGAAVGSIIPGIGTLIGGVVGGAVGALSSLAGPGKTDPETTGVKGLINAESANGNNPNIAASDPNPYLGLAGLMDEKSSTLPEYQQYGRMGEQAFTQGLTQQINDAYTKGTINKSSTPEQVYNQVVAPWVNSMGSGYNNVGSTYAATNQGLIEDMTQQYMTGQTGNWKTVGGSALQGITPYGAMQAGMGSGPAANAPKPVVAGQVAQGYTANARGGHVDANARRRLREVYAGSYGQRKTHYDDGGYVSYAGTPAASNFDWFPGNATPPASGVNSSGVPTDIAAPDNSGAYGMGFWNDAPTSSPSTSGSSGSSSSPSGLAGLLSGLGMSGSTASAIAPYAALLPLLNSALGGNKGATQPTLPSQYTQGVTNINTAPADPRVATNPNMSMNQWLTAGERPEMPFYANNAIPATGMSDPNQQLSQSLAAAGYAPSYVGSNPNAPGAQGQLSGSPSQMGGGGMGAPGSPLAQATQNYGYNGNPYGQFAAQMGMGGGGGGMGGWQGGINPGGPMTSPAQPAQPAAPPPTATAQPMPADAPRPLLFARGGPSNPYEAYGQNPGSQDPGNPYIGHVKGPGDGTSDSIRLKNAFLSNGEFVMDAPTVSMIGNGSNDSGAKWLEGLRKHVRVHGGKSLVKGKQPMDTSDAASAYAYGGAMQ